MAVYDTLLSNWPTPYTTLTVPTRHGETFVIAGGTEGAPPLVLLHGAGTNSATWAGEFAAYAPFFRLYGVDLIGEAGRSAQNRPEWKGPAFAEWMEDVLDGLGVTRVTLEGLSQGGWTALKFAVAHPERVEKLVLLAPGGVVPDRASFLARAIILGMLGKRGMRRISRSMFGDQAVPEGVEDITVLVSSNFNPRIGVLPVFTDEELRRLTMPVLLLGGEKDIIRDNEKIAARLRGLLPRLDVTIVPGAGHALLNTPPLVLPFLTGDPVPA
jgi:pimeloyl-ACP methyl ester carboxylesterase